MKKFKLFIIAASSVAFISCSKSHTEIVNEEISLDVQSRGATSQNNYTEDGGVASTVTPWIENIIDTIVATEMPKDEVKTDTIPNDSIPNDSTKSNSLKSKTTQSFLKK